MLTHTRSGGRLRPASTALLLPAAWLLLVATPSIVTGQTPTPPAPPLDCNTPDHRAFDFWIGDWNVTVGGNQAGTNRITREEGGCILHEHWIGAGGGTGQSFNFFDRRTREWNQVWVDNRGGVLRFRGVFEGGTLHYKSSVPTAAGGTVEHRLLFTPNPDGTVRQLWESSSDGGKSWTVAFDGLYTRKGN